MFDAVIAVCDVVRAERLGGELSEAVVRASTDWVQAAGPETMSLHDLIDNTSVRVGRQQAVGDGSPMTSWHDDAITIAEMCEVAVHCHGGCDHVLVVVVGAQGDLDEVFGTLKRRLTSTIGE